MKVIVEIPGSILGDLNSIGRNGSASSGYSQDEQFCIIKALEEFIKKYNNQIKAMTISKTEAMALWRLLNDRSDLENILYTLIDEIQYYFPNIKKEAIKEKDGKKDE